MNVESSVAKPPFVIFLDIDGVLYNKPDQDAVYKKVAELYPDAVKCYNNDICSEAAAHFFDKESLKNLDNLISEIEKTAQVSIVISSSWREGQSVERLKKALFGIHNFSKYIIDKTPEKIEEKEWVTYCCSKKHADKYSWQCRAVEIQFWLKQNPKISNYVVIDDNDDHLSTNFGKKFVRTNYYTLLTRKISEEILLQYKGQKKKKRKRHEKA